MTTDRKFPSTRLRRLRLNSSIQNLVAETQLMKTDLIQPIFIKEGLKGIEQIESLPGINRYGSDAVLNEVEDLANLNIGAIAIFPVIDPAKKDNHGSEATNDNNFLINEIKKFSIAEIKHEDCIGCTICIKVCPVDAIIGAKHKIHFIIIDQCNGCELCISECPVNCMEMIVNPAEESWAWPSQKSYQSKNFYNNKKLRLNNQKKEKALARERLASSAKIKSYIKDALLREENKRKQTKVYE